MRRWPLAQRRTDCPSSAQRSEIGPRTFPTGLARLSAELRRVPQHDAFPRKPLKPAAQEFKRKHPSAARLIERLVMWRYKPRIQRSERPRLRVLEETIQTVRAQHAKFCEHGFA